MTATTTTSSPVARRASISDVRIVREYPHPPSKVWRVLTDPALMVIWAPLGRPEGFAPVPGTRFRLIGKPMPGWRGFVESEVIEARELSVLRYSWMDEENGNVSQVSYRLDPLGSGTRFTFEHTGLAGVGGFLFAKLLLGPIRKKMFGARIPALLADLDDEGNLRPGSAHAARS